MKMARTTAAHERIIDFVAVEVSDVLDDGSVSTTLAHKGGVIVLLLLVWHD
jgi:hypothetical protein